LTSDGERFGIGSEELLQRLWTPAGDRTNCAGCLKVPLGSAEVLPEMGQMIERMRIEPRLYCLGLLLVGDRYIANWTPYRFAQSLDNLSGGKRFGDQINTVRRQAKVGQKSCAYAGHVFGAGEKVWKSFKAISSLQPQSRPQ
jgi:hypothetical protein